MRSRLERCETQTRGARDRDGVEGLLGIPTARRRELRERQVACVDIGYMSALAGTRIRRLGRVMPASGNKRSIADRPRIDLLNE
jgi:hypothetical protein